jgi:hypothetical protein
MLRRSISTSALMKSVARALALVLAAVLCVVLSPLLVPLALYWLASGFVLKMWWWRKHGRFGRHFLVVYSDSPKWVVAVPQRVLPLLGDRAVVVNISKDSSWKASRALERRVHKHWGGRAEHTPIAIQLFRFRRVREVRLYEAFMQNAKRGDSSELEEKLAALHAMVQSSPP